MLYCLLVSASNLPSVKKDQRSDPVASLTFRGESPVATAPARPRHSPLRAHRLVCGAAPILTLVQPHVSSPLSRDRDLSPVFFRGSEEGETEHNKCHSALKFWKTERVTIYQQLTTCLRPIARGCRSYWAVGIQGGLGDGRRIESGSPENWACRRCALKLSLYFIHSFARLY